MGGTSSRWNCCNGEGARGRLVEQYDDAGHLLQDPRGDGDGDDSMPQRISSDICLHGPDFGDVWPDNWGITIVQLRSFLDECRSDPKWRSSNTMRDWVNDYVIPKTRGTGLGYALYRNCRQPTEVSVVVSNCWLQNAELFVDRVASLVSPTDGLFVCGFALYQCEDGHGPTIRQQLGDSPEQSPFMRVVRHLGRAYEAERDMLCRRADRMGPAPQFPTLLAVASIALPVAWKGCVPTLGECAEGSGFGGSPFSAMTPGSWQFAEADPACTFVAVSGAILALSGALGWLRLWWRPFEGGRMIAVPNLACDPCEGEAGLCCATHVDGAEPGVCIVKLEMYGAQALGLPIVIANSLKDPSKKRRAACSTKADTEKLEAAEDDGDRENYEDIRSHAAASLHQAQASTFAIDVAEFLTVCLCSSCFVHVTANGFEAGRGWPLVAGFVAGSVGWIAVLARMAMQTGGRLSAKGIVCLASGLLAAASVTAAALGVASMTTGQGISSGLALPLAGSLSAALTQGAAVLFTVTLLTAPCGRRMAMDAQNLAGFLVLTIGLVAMACSVRGRPRHAFPVFVVAASGLFGLFLGPVALVSNSFARWGVTIRR